MSKESVVAEPAWAVIRDFLEAKRKETFEALRNYPRQVAGCDTHYQHLAEERARISGELRQLDTLSRERPCDGIAEFVRMSAYIDDDAIPGLRGKPEPKNPPR